MEAINCPICHGSGCGNCAGAGVLAVDESGRQFYVRRGAQGLEVLGPKVESGALVQRFENRFFAWFENLLAEPRDLLWAIKQLGGDLR